MAITVTKIHIARVLRQVEHMLTSLQRSMVNNAQTHKAMATAQSPNIATLKGMVQACAATYSNNLGWVTTLQGKAAVWNALMTMWQAWGGAAADVNNLVNALTNASTALGAAPLNTYADVTAACNSVLASVDLPPSLWPE